MATTQQYGLPYPEASDPVNVHGDIKSLADKLTAVLPLASYSQLAVMNDSGQGIGAGWPVYVTGYSTVDGVGKTLVAKATSNTTQPILGLAKTPIPNGDDGIVVVSGVLENINTTSFAAGDILYAGPSGGLTTVQDVGGAVGVVVHNSENGIIVVEAKGNGTWGALKAGLA